MRSVVFILVFVLSCSPTGPSPKATVRGSVTFQGRALIGAMVVFAPDHAKGGRGKPYHAITDEQGTYVLTRDGAGVITPGWYRVALADPAGTDWERYGWPRFPEALRRPDRSGLEREVKAGQDHEFHFHVEVPDSR